MQHPPQDARGRRDNLEDNQREIHFGGLPQELVRAVVSKLDLRVSTPHQLASSAADLRAHNSKAYRDLPVFSKMLLVSKSIKAMTEELHPETLSSYQNNIANLLVERPSQLLAIEMSRSPALAQLKNLQIDVYCWESQDDYGEGDFTDLRQGIVGDRLDSLNTLMALCPRLQSFHFDLSFKKLNWAKLEVWRSTSLRKLELVSVSSRHESDTGLDLGRAESIESFCMKHDHVETDIEWPCPLAELPPNVQRLELALMLDSEALERLNIVELPNLAELHLRHNPLQADGISILQVGASQTLKKVDLEGTWNGNEGLEALGLGGGGMLEELEISHNGITDPSFLRLEHNTSLKKLNMGHNPLANLAFALDRNSSLRELDLSGMCGPSRARSHFQSLSRQLAHNTILEGLLLGWFDLTDAMLDGLELPASSGLQVLDLRGNDISAATINHLSSQVKGLEVRWSAREPSYTFIPLDSDSD